MLEIKKRKWPSSTLSFLHDKFIEKSLLKKALHELIFQIKEVSKVLYLLVSQFTIEIKQVRKL